MELRMDFRSLTDSALIDLMTSRENADAAEELAIRTLPKLRKALNTMIFSTDSMCPPSEDRAAFLEDVLSIASLKVIRGIRTFKEDLNFEGWLYRIAKNAVLDQIRYIERHARPCEPIESIDQQQVGHVSDELPRSFRSSFWANPAGLVFKREMHDVVKSALTIHEQENPASAHAIRFCILNDGRLADIAQMQGICTRTVRRLLVHDYCRLQELLGDAFGIGKLTDITTE